MRDLLLMIDLQNNALMDTARRVLNVDFYGAMDADETPETIAETIKNEPLTVINFLLDMIDDLQA